MANIETVTAGDIDSKVLKAAGAVVLDLYQASCAPCRVLEPRLERFAKRYKGQVPVYRVDLDRDMKVAERFGVKSIPTLLVFGAGKEINRLDGLITADDLTAAFDAAAKFKREP